MQLIIPILLLNINNNSSGGWELSEFR